MKFLRTISVAIGSLVAGAALIGLRDERMLSDPEPPATSPGFAVVELFTSEGCSSCPPADELVGKIQADDKTGQLYVLAFHVDYWDHQGWKDRFSDKEYTKRQSHYEGWLNLETIYTPQIIINGTTEHVGSDKNSVLKAISRGLARETTKELTLTARIEGGQALVEYLGTSDDKHAELVLVLIQKSAQSNVKAGENSGRSLFHVQVVRKMIRTPLESTNKNAIAIGLTEDFNIKGWEIIGFVQNTFNGRITSAARFDFGSEPTSVIK